MNDPLEDSLRRHLASLDDARLPDATAVALASRRVADRQRRRTRRFATAGGAFAVVALVTAGVLAGRDDGGGRSVVAGDTTAAAPTSTDAATSTAAPTTTVVPGPGWQPVPAAPRDPFVPQQVVWTGSEAVTVTAADASYVPSVDAYDPASRAWRTIADDVPVAVPIAAWTGESLLLVGWDLDRLNTAAVRVDVATGEVTAGAQLPFGFKSTLATPHAWTGSMLLLLTSEGVVGYDVAADEWRTLAAAPIEARTDAASVWTGSEWLVWGGSNLAGTGNFSDGAAYDPATDSWRVLAPSPLGGRLADGVWSGSELLVMAGRSSNQNGMFAFSDGAAYDPATDSWRDLPDGPAHPGFRPAFDGTTLYLFAKGGVAAYDMATDEWSDFDSTGIPCHSDDTPLWTGTSLLALGCWDGTTGGAEFTPST